MVKTLKPSSNLMGLRLFYLNVCASVVRELENMWRSVPSAWCLPNFCSLHVVVVWGGNLVVRTSRNSKGDRWQCLGNCGKLLDYANSELNFETGSVQALVLV